MNVDTKKPGRSTLEGVPERVSRFLRGTANNGHIRAALAAEGYDDADHQEGWDLFHRVSGYAPSKPVAVDRSASLAMAELDRLDAGLIDKIDATLGGRFPAQRDVVLAGLAPAERALAVANVKHILDRVAALEASADGADQSAVARLAKVKLDGAERARLAALVAQAESFEGRSAAPLDAEEIRWTRLEPAYVALYAWFNEWSRAAARAITRRDWLLTLGLAKRRTTRAAAEPDVGEPDEDVRGAEA
jgi:hypothetical protein